jgi:DNA-binding SARP family transcriptional activator
VTPLLDGVRAGRGGALVVRTSAGSGADGRFELADLIGAPEDLTVLAARGRKSEVRLRYYALFDVLRPVLCHLGHIPVAQADALRGALALDHVPPGEPFGVAAATLSLLGAAARERPVLLLDDVQWLDPASLRTFEFVARRVEREPVAVLLALRRPDGDGLLRDLPEIDLAAGNGAAPSRAGLRPATDPPSPVSCRVMGRFAVTAHGRPVRLPGLSGRLVAYLAVRGEPVPAEELVDVFWPENDPDQGRARLRKVVWRVRRERADLVDRYGDLLALHPGVAVDLDRFTAAADEALRLADDGGAAGAARSARAALARYHGDLLPALRYEDWTDGPRRAARRRYVALLDVVVEDAAGHHDSDRALAALERAIAADPYDESRYLRGVELGLPPSTAAVEAEQRVRGG